MDYLARDSLHAGVPYGRNFDQQRLIGSLCLNEAGDGLAITDKGQTAAEMMVFARYVMFSEVYWHHAVRVGDGHAAAGVLSAARHARSRRAVPPDRAASGSRSCGARPAKARPASCSTDCSARRGGSTSGWPQYSFFEERSMYERLARQPYPWLAACAEQFAAVASTALGRVVAPHEMLFDAPPVEREVEFHVEVYFPKERRLPPAGRRLARRATRWPREQFDDYVKRVRIFAHPRVADDLRKLTNLSQLAAEAVERTE